MKDALRVVAVSLSEITVSWSSYRPPMATGAAAGTRPPAGVVQLSSYDVELTTNDRDWTVVGSEPAAPAAANQTTHSVYRHRVGQLVPGTRYRLRLVIVWLDAQQRPSRSVPGPPTTLTRTHCRMSVHARRSLSTVGGHHRGRIIALAATPSN